MNRRSFLQIIAAAAALPVFPKIKPVRSPVRIEWNGYVFTEDPNPLRFILTPEDADLGETERRADRQGVIERFYEGVEPYTEAQFIIAGSEWRARLNPAWCNARFEFDGFGLRDRFPERGPIFPTVEKESSI